MTIKYDKLLHIFEEKKINSYTMRKNKILGQSVYKKILEGGHIDTRTINKLCEYLNCQPGDIMEYVPDEQKGEIEIENEAERN